MNEFFRLELIMYSSSKLFLQLTIESMHFMYKERKSLINHRLIQYLN